MTAHVVRGFGLCLLGGLALTRPARAAAKPEPSNLPDPVLASLARFGQAIQRVTLDNGLVVVMNPDHGAATVAVSVTYRIGSRSEEAGRTGFAHLFEHMMFQGSRHAPKGWHFALVSERGGSLNGTTNTDRTNYYEALPKSELPLALWLEADRLRFLEVTPVTFENQRAVVEEEYRMRIQNQPYAAGMVRLGELVYAGYPPYAHDTIGSMADLGAARFEWVRQFHDRYYAADNAILTIAGDFEPSQALPLVHEYFDEAERKAPPLVALPPAPEHPNAARASVEDTNARTPAALLGFMIPRSHTAEHYALELAAVLLADGESSRLHKTLVHDRAVAESVSAWTEDHVGPDQLSVMAVLTDKGTLPDVEAALDAELARLSQSAPTAAELDKAKRQLRQRFVFGLQTNLGRAIALGETEANFGDASLLASELSHYLAVTPDDVRRAAQLYLRPERRSLVEVLPQVAEPGHAGR